MAELTLEEARNLYKQSASLKSLMLTKFSKEIRRVEKEINDRPRKVHGFYTAGEMYRSILTGKPVALGS